MGGSITLSLVRVHRNCWRVLENSNKEEDSDMGSWQVWAKSQNAQNPGKEQQGDPLEPMRQEHTGKKIIKAEFEQLWNKKTLGENG